MAESDVFVSYLASDVRTLGPILEGLEQAGLTFAPRSIGAGEEWFASIEEALRGARFFVFLVTPGFQRSRWTQFEVGVAAGRATASADVRIIPVLATGTSWDDVPRALKGHQGIDGNQLSHSQIVERLLAAIRC